MARLGSQALAGYYPFPASLLPAVAARLDLSEWRTHDGLRPGLADTLTALDPCCGEGHALLGLLQHALGWDGVCPDKGLRVQVYGCELETQRARRARRLWTTALPMPHRVHVEGSDLFRLQIPQPLPPTTPGAHLLWLNPPYDTDPEYGRLEERFLRWTTPLLLPGSGILCFVIPRHAVAASAVTLAREYSHLRVYRLPDPHYALYKQVIVFGQRRPQPCTVPGLCEGEMARLREWTRDDTAPPVLPGPDTPPDLMMARQPGGLPALPALPVDMAALRPHLRLWVGGTSSSSSGPETQGTANLLPLAAVGAHQTLADLSGAVHQSALPPLPTHTALILASGMINGQTVRPDAPDSPLPPLVITGHFQRVAQLTDTHENAQGTITSYKYDEKPRLRVDLLALTSPPQFYTLKEGSEPTGTTDLAEMNTADLLVHYGRGLADLITAQFPPLHNPADPAHQLALPALARPLFAAQGHAVCALLKIIARDGENPLLVGEMGTGKTAMLLSLAWALAPANQPGVQAALRAQFGPHIRLRPVRHALVACPPHLVDNWEREIRSVLPGARVRRIERLTDLHQPAPPATSASPIGTGLTFDILSREDSKLGHAYSPHALGRLPINPRAQAVADYLAAARAAGLTTYAGVTNHLRQATKQVELTVSTATADDLQRATAALDAPPLLVRCARCGTLAEADERTLIATRARCAHRPQQPTGPLAPFLRPLTALLAPFYPAHAAIGMLHPQPAPAAERAPHATAAWAAQLGGNGAIRRLLFGHTPDTAPPKGNGLLTLIEQQYAGGRFTHLSELLGGLTGLLATLPDASRVDLIPPVVERLYPMTADRRQVYGPGALIRQTCLLLIALLPDVHTRQELIARLRPMVPLDVGRQQLDPWDQLASTLAHLAYRARQLSTTVDPAVRATLQDAYPITSGIVRPSVPPFPMLDVDPATGALLWEGQHPVGTPAPALRALETLLALTSFQEGSVCGEPLVQAIPRPRRVALARYILKHYRHQYGLVALDEAHEAAHAETAQGQAYYRLAALPGAITVALTGTPMNGYASSVFALWWHLNRGFRRLFRRTDRERFIRQYGYRRLVAHVEDPGKRQDSRPRLRGSQSDAVVGGLKMEVVGEAPGMAPSFLLHLLPHSVPIHLAHLDAVLPPREERRVPVTVAAEDTVGTAMLESYGTLMKGLVNTIRASLRDPDLAGKLWGHLFEAGLSYPLLCTTDTGNGLDAAGQPHYRLTYPASCGEHYAGQVLADAPLFPASTVLPHEAALLNLVRRERAAGRNVIVYLRHTGTPRLARRLARLLGGVAPAVYLDVSRVPPAKRDGWIRKEVLGRRVPILLTNAEAVKTGLNCLTPYFKTAIWFEPTLNTATFRQAGARIRRIGAHPTDPIREYLLYYDGTAQAAAMDLILQKVQHSQLFDGLDLHTTLAAAGVGGDDLTMLLGSGAVSFGKALYQHLQTHHQLLRALPFAAPALVPIPAGVPQLEPVLLPMGLQAHGKPVQLSLFS